MPGHTVGYTYTEQTFDFMKRNHAMTRIPEHDRDVLERAIYLPMLLTVLDRDLLAVEQSGLKLKKPYLELIEETMKTVQKDLGETKRYMKKNSIKLMKLGQDEAFTMYLFQYKGYEEEHHYFNPRIRNKVQELMVHYLFKRHEKQKLSR